jgi:hypothetical protein
MAIYTSSQTSSSRLLRCIVPHLTLERPNTAASVTLVISLLIFAAASTSPRVASNAANSSSSASSRSIFRTAVRFPFVKLLRSLDVKRFARFWRTFYRDDTTKNNNRSILSFLLQFIRPWWITPSRSHPPNDGSDEDEESSTNASSLTTTSSRRLESIMRNDPFLGPYLMQAYLQDPDDENNSDDSFAVDHDENVDPRSNRTTYTTQTMEQTVYKLRKVISSSSSASSGTSQPNSSSNVTNTI